MNIKKELDKISDATSNLSGEFGWLIDGEAEDEIRFNELIRQIRASIRKIGEFYKI